MTYSVSPIVGPSFGRASTARHQIFNTIYKLKNPKPHQIKKYLDEAGKTTTLRTIHRWLKKLSNEGAVINIGGKYSLSERDLRYVGVLLGSLAMDHICDGFQDRVPRLPINESLRKLVTGFGVLAFYTFIEAARPVQDNGMSNKQKDDLIDSWLKRTFPVTDMFRNFLAAYRESTDADYKLKPAAGKLEGDYIVSHNELIEVTIIELARVLQEMYPHEYSQIQVAKQDITSQISENLRELKRDLPGIMFYSPDGL